MRAQDQNQEALRQANLAIWAQRQSDTEEAVFEVVATLIVFGVIALIVALGQNGGCL